jgi:SAM-dependent methyltransferase
VKVCVACGSSFDGREWECASCGWTAPVEEGVVRLTTIDTPGFEASAFERLAAIEAGHFWFRARNKLLVWALGRHFPEARSLMDVGSGSGYVLAGFAQARPELALAAGDPYLEAFRVSAARVPSAERYQLDVSSLPFDQEFDVVCAFDVLEHVDDDALALREMAHAARPGGGVLITVPQHPRLWSAADEYGHHRRRYTRRELVGKVEAAGLHVEHVTSFMTLLLPVMALARFRDRGRGAAYDPDTEMRVPGVVNRAFEALLGAERALIRAGVSLPAGGSLLLVARRP